MALLPHELDALTRESALAPPTSESDFTLHIELFRYRSDKTEWLARVEPSRASQGRRWACVVRSERERSTEHDVPIPSRELVLRPECSRCVLATQRWHGDVAARAWILSDGVEVAASVSFRGPCVNPTAGSPKDRVSLIVPPAIREEGAYASRGAVLLHCKVAGFHDEWERDHAYTKLLARQILELSKRLLATTDAATLAQLSLGSLIAGSGR